MLDGSQLFLTPPDRAVEIKHGPYIPAYIPIPLGKHEFTECDNHRQDPPRIQKSLLPLLHSCLCEAWAARGTKARQGGSGITAELGEFSSSRPMAY